MLRICSWRGGGGGGAFKQKAGFTSLVLSKIKEEIILPKKITILNFNGIR